MAERELRFEALVEPERDRSAAAQRNRLLTLVTAGGVTIGGLVLALVLGTFGYELRRSNAHETRLRGILIQEPTVYQVTEGLKEKAPLVSVVDSARSLAAVSERWGDGRAAEIREKAEAWPQLRVFDAGDMMYFIFFDEDDIMRDYLYVTKRGKSEGGRE